VLTASIFALMMEVVSAFETPVSFYETAWRNIPEYSHIHKCTLLMILAVLSGSTVTTAWRVLGLRMEETASRYGG
jgi:hypothetical protein